VPHGSADYANIRAMKRRSSLTGAIGVSLILGATAGAEAPRAVPQITQKGASVSQASGTFEVKVKPLPTDEKVPGLKVGRLSLDKVFQGDLVGTSLGEMSTAETTVEGSGGYVAIERFKGALRGRSGEFSLLHQGTMRRGGDFNLNITVVPDSGTGQLSGLTGKMTITIEGKQHSYTLDYTLPDAP
jgi:hypothetical protein